MSFPEPNDLPQDHNPNHEQAAQKEQILKQILTPEIEKKGRVVSKNGMQKLDRLATEILNELILEKPELKIYR